MMDGIRYGRKRKGIKKALNDKIEDWCQSILDQATDGLNEDEIQKRTTEAEQLVKAIKRDVIITGGSIVSMLLGERVNDYDVYFRTKATTKLVAEHYVKRYNDANPTKVKEGVSSYEPFVQEETIKNIKGVEEERIVVFAKSAGVAGEDQSTYAYFEGEPQEATERFVDDVCAAKEGEDDSTKPRYRPVFMSQNAITLSHALQLVIRFYGEPDKIHSNYDFVHATCYFDYHAQDLVLPGEALECLLSRTLIYQGSLYPIASIFRMKKFIERGWRITAGQQLKIMWQIAEIDMSDFTILREQLTGVDMAYMWELIEALKDTDQSKICSTYIGEIIDRIFD